MTQKPDDLKDAFIVFQGGGTKVFVLVGAWRALSSRIRPQGFAGTSAGAIVGCLAAAGYTADEISQISLDTDLSQFLPRFVTVLGRLRLIKSLFRWFGKASLSDFIYPVTFRVNKGVFDSKRLQSRIEELLQKKLGPRQYGYVTFEDLPYDLKIIVADITNCCMEVYDRQSHSRASVAEAVCASASLPFLFKPFVVGNRSLIDGGAASNFPIWAFEIDPTSRKQRFQTIGLMLVNRKKTRNTSLIGYWNAILDTSLNASQNIVSNLFSSIKLVPLVASGVDTVSMGLSNKQKVDLISDGEQQMLFWLSSNSSQLERPAHSHGLSTRVYVKDFWTVFEEYVRRPVASNKGAIQKIEILGLNLRTAWEFTREMIEKHWPNNMELALAMIDPDGHCAPLIGESFVSEARSHSQRIIMWLEKNKQTCIGKGIRVSLSYYDWTPCIHGIRINGNRIFVSFTTWTEKDMSAPGNIYEYYSDKNDPDDKWHFDLFENWFCKATETKAYYL